MVPALRNCVLAAATLLFATSLADTSKQHTCPIGFTLAYTRHKDEPICYKLKGPEHFTDKFHDCSGNLYTTKLYNSLNIPKPNVMLWAEYKSLYSGGPFVDWSFTTSTGELLLTTFEVRYDRSLGIDEELCVAIHPQNNLTAVRCDEIHYRYCFVKPYPSGRDITDEGCEELPDYYRFWSPRPTCLTGLSGVGGGAIRATWQQSQELCKKRGGTLLHRGWRYANNPILHTSSNWTVPLGMSMLPVDALTWSIAEDGGTSVPDPEWSFRSDETFSTDTSLVALHESNWQLVNTTYVFLDVICERSIHLRNVSMTVDVDTENRISLFMSEPVDENDIYCFSDSVIYYPSSVKVYHDDINDVYSLKPITDGYYWCVHVDSENYRVAGSNRALYIRDKQSAKHLYAVKLKVKQPYRFESLEKLFRSWERKLKQYIYYSTKYVKAHGQLDSTDYKQTERKLKLFKSQNPDLEWNDSDVVYLTKIKKLFLDRKTVVLHVQLHPNMEPVPPGTWDELEVVFMKGAYYCTGFDMDPTPVGGYITRGCRTHTCVGEFSEGVQWVTSATPGCLARTPVLAESDVLVELPTVTFSGAYNNQTPGPTMRGYSSSEEDPPGGAITTKEPCGPTEPTIRPPTEIPSTPIEINVTLPVVVTEPNSLETVSTVNTPTEEVHTVSVITGDSSEEDTSTVAITIKPPRPPPTLPPLPTIAPPTPEVPVPPQEQLQNVMDDLQSLLNNDSIPVQIENFDNTFDRIDVILDVEEEDLTIPAEFLHLLDEIGTRLELDATLRAYSVRNNIALLVADAAPEAPLRGLRIAARENDSFTNDAFEFITDEVPAMNLTSEQNEAVVQLPQSLSESGRRVSFVVFRNDRAFTADAAVYTVNSRVLAINVDNVTSFNDGEVIDIHLRPLQGEVNRNESRACAYWEFLEDGSGYWSQEGCTFIPATEEGMLDTCRCDHLTHFAEILIPRTAFSEKNEAALEILSIIGCSVSLLGLLMIGLTAIMFRSWRRDFSNKIWLQLCIAVALLIICFLIVAFAKFDTYNVPCMLVGVALHYSVLASFCWMLVAAVLSYRRLVLVFTRDASHKLLRASAFSWGAPCAVVGILLSVAPHSYAGRFDETTPSGAFCYPSGLALWLAVYAPVLFMLLINWVLFILIVRSVFASRRIQRHGDTKEALRCATVSCLLVFLFGLPWIFGIFASNIVAAYLFTLTATFQGVILFVFFVVGNKKTRDMWLNKLKIKQTRKVPVTTSTVTHKSSGVGRGNSGAASMAANSSKPRSLSQDDSRFS